GTCNWRGLAKASAAKGKKKAGGKGKEEEEEEVVVVEAGPMTIPVNFLKDGSDPIIKSDEEYPEWLWNLEVRSQRNKF
ncbi:unnamed protein product, partial [Choristocarpus tenellus]